MAYGTDDGLSAWLAAAGVSLPEGSSLPVARARGTMYIDSVYGARFKGTPTAGVDQSDAFPRQGLVVYDRLLAADLIPSAILSASYRAAYLIESGALTLDVSDPTRIVKREKADGAAEREFFAPPFVNGERVTRATDTVIDALLAPFLEPLDAGTGQGIWAIGSGGASRPASPGRPSDGNYYDGGLPLASEEW